MKQYELAPAHRRMELGWRVCDAKCLYLLMSTCVVQLNLQRKTGPQVIAYCLPHVL